MSIVPTQGAWLSGFPTEKLQRCSDSLHSKGLGNNGLRPICLLPYIGKVFKNILMPRVINYLEMVGEISKRQFGFCRRRKTISQLSVVPKDTTISGGFRVFVGLMGFCIELLEKKKVHFNRIPAGLLIMQKWFKIMNQVSTHQSIKVAMRTFTNSQLVTDRLFD